MEIPSLSSLYTVAPGTPNSPVRPKADLSFEESNNAVDSALDRVDQARETRDAQRDTVRGAAADIYEQQTTRNNAETYLRVTAEVNEQNDQDTLISPAPASIIDVQDVRQAQRNMFRAQALDVNSNNDSAQEQLRRTIEEASTPRQESPLVDIQV